MKTLLAKISMITGILVVGNLLLIPDFTQAAKPTNRFGHSNYGRAVDRTLKRPDLTVKVNWYSEHYGKIIVTNIGKGIAQPSVLRLRCTGGWGRGDREEWKIGRCTFPGNNNTKFFSVPALKPGKNYIINTNVSEFRWFKCDKSRSYAYSRHNRYTISAYIDANYKIPEIRENNNYAYQKKQLACGSTFLKNRKNRKARKPDQQVR